MPVIFYIFLNVNKPHEEMNEMNNGFIQLVGQRVVRRINQKDSVQYEVA